MIVNRSDMKWRYPLDPLWEAECRLRGLDPYSDETKRLIEAEDKQSRPSPDPPAQAPLAAQGVEGDPHHER